MLTRVDIPLGLEVPLTAYENEQAARAERAREAADARLSKRDRGELVRKLAAAEHTGPFGEPVRVSRPTIDRWIRTWRAGGFDALLPPLRQVSPRTRADVLELAAALKREQPRRSAPFNAYSYGWSSTPARTAAHRPRSAGSRPKPPTNCGSPTRCTALRSQAMTCLQEIGQLRQPWPMWRSSP
jgi:hypothetical protein